MGAGTYTSSISGLSAATNYYAKAFVTNSAGTNYGSVVNFTTAAASSPASFGFSNSNLSGNLPNYYIATNNLTLSQLPIHHNDPFDRLLLSQSTIENMPLISADEKFKYYDNARIIW